MKKEYEINVIKTDKVWFVQDREEDSWKREYNIKELLLNGKQPEEQFVTMAYKI